MEHLGNAEEEKKNAVSQNPPASQRERDGGGDVYKDGSCSGHKSRGWLIAGDDLSVWHKYLGIS